MYLCLQHLCRYLCRLLSVLNVRVYPAIIDWLYPFTLLSICRIKRIICVLCGLWIGDRLIVLTYTFPFILKSNNRITGRYLSSVYNGVTPVCNILIVGYSPGLEMVNGRLTIATPGGPHWPDAYRIVRYSLTFFRKNKNPVIISR